MITVRFGRSQYGILTDPFFALSLAGVVSAAPDDQMFRHLAQIYATNHLTMHRGNICEGDNFKGKRGVFSAAPNDQVYKAPA